MRRVQGGDRGGRVLQDRFDSAAVAEQQPLMHLRRARCTCGMDRARSAHQGQLYRLR